MEATLAREHSEKIICKYMKLYIKEFQRQKVCEEESVVIWSKVGFLETKEKMVIQQMLSDSTLEGIGWARHTVAECCLISLYETQNTKATRHI